MNKPWRHTIRMTFRETAKASANALAVRLRSLPSDFRELWNGGTTLDEMIEWLDDLEQDASADEFDGILEEVYDWADRHRLWLHISDAPEAA